MKNIIKEKWFTFGTYILVLLASLFVGCVLFQSNTTLHRILTSFFEVAENRTFDYRQTLRVLHKRPAPSDDIVVVAIDDASLEMLWDKYGEWPIPRSVYANMINHIEKDKPKAIIFDLMFIKSMRSNLASDKALTDAFNKYDNIYTAMNFDDVEANVRVPEVLPQRIKSGVSNKSGIDISKKYSYSNCRLLLPEIMNGTVKIGMSNVIRSNDGIIRKVAPLMEYKGDYYPYLAFKAGSDFIVNESIKEYQIEKNGDLKVGETVLPLTEEGDVILNWYGQSGTHTIYPMYMLIHDINGRKNTSNAKTMNFKDKIVIFGTTAMSLRDTKSVPIQEDVYPGVEVHATFLNNMIDNNFVRKTDLKSNILIAVLVIALVSSIVMLSTSAIFALLSTALFGIAYVFVSYYVLAYANLWIPVAMPIIFVVLTFALSYIAKYIIKSKDFEYQYKLATVDGLTELYNHRYFQDTLRNQIEVSKRYNQEFSLIIIDIDFFKKFNDTYGHQVGDAVLKQVAQILKKNSRTTDFVCRYGGEEMSIILPNTTAEEVLFNANRINKAVAEHDFQISDSKTVKVTISVGISTYPQDAQTAQELIEFADKGLYYAKEHGRNQVAKFDKDKQ